MKRIYVIALGTTLLAVSAFAKSTSNCSSPATVSREAEPGDDRGHGAKPEPGDDRGRGRGKAQLAREAEPGDDRGRGVKPEPGDDRGRGRGKNG